MKDLFKEYSIELDSLKTEVFEKLLVLFKLRNAQINLSAIREEKDIIHKHFIDSIMLLKFEKLSWKILDIWTWWWFPWIPLSIIEEDADFTLIDSTRKKIDSVNYFVSELWLKNVRWVWGRAEELSSLKEFYHKFDFVVSRATAYLPQIIDWGSPFLKFWWKMIIYKTYNKEEIDDWLKYLWHNAKMYFHEYVVLWQDRVFIVISL